MRYFIKYISLKIISFVQFLKVGSFSKALTKGPTTTIWIWNLHAEAHDLLQQCLIELCLSRKVFTVNLAHLSIIFLWLLNMHLHVVYYFNYSLWSNDLYHVVSCFHLVWNIINQDTLNIFVGGEIISLYITSRMFYLFRSEGIISLYQLIFSTTTCLICSFIIIMGSYFHLHVVWFSSLLIIKYRFIGFHHFLILFSFGSLSWSSHQFHIALPLNEIINFGVDIYLIPSPFDLLFSSFSNLCSFGSIFITSSYLVIFISSLNFIISSLLLFQVALHHFYVGLVFIFIGLLLFIISTSQIKFIISNLTLSWDAQLALNLSILGSLSIVYAHHVYLVLVYFYLSLDVFTLVSIFIHYI